MLYICIFPACCFRQRTYVAHGFVNVELNETWTHSCFLLVRLVYIGVVVLLSWSVFTLVCFTRLWYLICLWLCVCVCVCVCVCWLAVVLGFTNNFCVLVSILRSFVVLNLLVVLSPFFCICIRMSMYMCVCVFSFFLSSENMFGIKSS